jgi:hypothetical protein
LLFKKWKVNLRFPRSRPDDNGQDQETV